MIAFRMSRRADVTRHSENVQGRKMKMLLIHEFLYFTSISLRNLIATYKEYTLWVLKNWNSKVVQNLLFLAMIYSLYTAFPFCLNIGQTQEAQFLFRTLLSDSMTKLL